MKRVAVHLVCAWQVLSLATQAQEPFGAPDYVSPAAEHRVFFSPGDPVLASLRAAGAVRRAEDYGSFVLAIVDERLAGGRDGLLALGARDPRRPGGRRDQRRAARHRGRGRARRALASIPAFLRGDELDAAARRDERLWIVQFAGPIRDAWLDAPGRDGRRRREPDGDERVRRDRRRTRCLAAFAALERDPAVQWIGAYHPFFRLAPDAPRRSTSAARPPSTSPSSSIAGDRPLELCSTRSPSGAVPRASARSSACSDFVERPARGPGEHDSGPRRASRRVRRSSRSRGRRCIDEAQGQIVAGNLNAGLTGPSAPGYLAWLASKGFSRAGQFAFVGRRDRRRRRSRDRLTDVNDEFKVLGAGRREPRRLRLQLHERRARRQRRRPRQHQRVDRRRATTR